MNEAFPFDDPSAVGYTRQGRPKKTEPFGFDEKTQLKLF
jgi:hypothetical protein